MRDDTGIIKAGKAKQNLKWRLSNKRGLLKKLEKLNSWDKMMYTGLIYEDGKYWIMKDDKGYVVY